MIELPTSLPAAVLLGQGALRLGARVSGLGGIWFSAADLEVEPGAAHVARWPARGWPDAAVPTEPNTGNARRGLRDGQAVLDCQAGTHCGFVYKDAIADAGTFSAAVFYHASAEADPRTLLCLNLRSNYVFLSVSDGTILLKDDQGQAEVTLAGAAPAPGSFGLIMLSLDPEGLLSVAAGGRRAQSVASLTGMHAPGDLFIACRSQRGGLAKTLGAAGIAEVFFFPGRSLVGTPDGARFAEAFDDYAWGGL